MLVLSVICAFMLQSSARVDDDTFGHLVELTSPFDVLVIFVLMSFVWLLIGRFWWSVGIVTAALAILAVASKQKLMMRQEPVFPSDMEFVGQAGFLLSMVTGQMIAGVVIGLVVLVLVIIVIGKLMSRWFPRPRLRRAEGGVNKRYLGLRILGVIVTGAMLIHTVSFNSDSNMWRALYDTNGEDWGNSSQLYNYRVHGFVGGPLGLLLRISFLPCGYSLLPPEYQAPFGGWIKRRIRATIEKVKNRRDRLLLRYSGGY